jgi:hypothetical protein
MTWLNRYQSTIKVLQQIPGLQLNTEYAAPVNPETVTLVEKLLGVTLSDNMHKFYSEMNGFKIIWQLPNGDRPQLTGYIQIESLEVSIGGKHKKLTKAHTIAHDGVLWNDESNKTTINKLKKFKLIEAPFGSSLCVAYNYSNLPIDKVWIVDTNEIKETPLNFQEYINYTLDNFGLPSARFNLMENDIAEATRNDQDIKNFEQKTGLTVSESLLRYFV